MSFQDMGKKGSRGGGAAAAAATTTTTTQQRYSARPGSSSTPSSGNNNPLAQLSENLNQYQVSTVVLYSLTVVS